MKRAVRVLSGATTGSYFRMLRGQNAFQLYTKASRNAFGSRASSTKTGSSRGACSCSVSTGGTAGRGSSEE